MAHEIYTLVNGKASMAYLSGTDRWHGLGNELKDGATIDAWLAAAGMEFDIISGEVIYKLGVAPTDPGAYRLLGTFPEKKVLYRSDSGTALSIVSNRYKVVQPREIMEFFRTFCETNQLKLKTAGVLRGGNRYWAMAETPEVVDVRRGHRHRRFILLSTSADGELATTARETDVCVVCNNTLTVATAQDGKNVYKNRHDQVFNARAAAEHLHLDITSDNWAEFGKKLKALDKVKVTEAMAADWFHQLLKTPAERAQEAVADKQASNFSDLLTGHAVLSGTVAEHVADVTPTSILRKMASLTEAYQNAPGAAPGTAYGLLQASTYYVDHLGKGRTPENQHNNAWFGDGEVLKNRAWVDATALLTL